MFRTMLTPQKRKRTGKPISPYNLSVYSTCFYQNRNDFISILLNLGVKSYQINQSDLDLPDISNKEWSKNQIIEAFRKTERKFIWIFAIAVPLFSLTPWLFTRLGF